MAHSVNSLLKQVLSPKKHWKLELFNNWNTIIGEMHAHVAIEKIYEKLIILNVTNACWMQELSILCPLLLKKINENLDKPRIKEIRFKQRGIRSAKKKNLKKEVLAEEKKVTITQTERDALQKIKDPCLSDMLEKFLIRCHKERT